MPDAAAAELADSIQQELIKSGKILSGDFARAFEEKNVSISLFEVFFS